ncbi:MAG: chemotaxis protein CheB [Acidimicrobiales bacterium]
MSAPSLIAVGASWGGLQACGVLLAALPREFPAPVAIVQHRSRESSGLAMVQYLQDRCALVVREVEDKDPIEPGAVHVAPADYQLLIGERFELAVDDPGAKHRPSIDLLFETAAKAYGAGVVAVVLTGAGSDGSSGLRAVKEAGGAALAEDPASAVRPEMPRAAIESGQIDLVLPLAQLASHIAALGAVQ